MSISVSDLQELPATELAALDDCCWNSGVGGCQMFSFGLSTCHSCTNTG